MGEMADWLVDQFWMEDDSPKPCPMCEGTGLDPVGAKCPDCNGTGIEG